MTLSYFLNSVFFYYIYLNLIKLHENFTLAASWSTTLDQ